MTLGRDELTTRGAIRMPAGQFGVSCRATEQLGCALDDGPFGPVIRTDAAKMTTVSSVYAAGDAARAPHNASWVAAEGMTAGVSLHQSLVFEPLAA